MNFDLFVAPLMGNKAHHLCSVLKNPVTENLPVTLTLNKLQGLCDEVIREVEVYHKAAGRLGGTEVFPIFEYPSGIIEVENSLCLSLETIFIAFFILFANRNSKVLWRQISFSSMRRKDI